ncbi:HAD family hydrolase [Campylobacter troglodytis]|uniref:HAD family hydrolase n=1 Tax=Campylobacter troglodytis TaxID=654363 RepID=UPI00115B54EA|nr:HAD family phosphatase [Campylobacter troglodytis]TQR58604.1 HAD family hydrolase [Campylobacter troglodytis]
MPKIKAIVFDMDGVLIEAKHWHFEALNRALSLFGMEISYFEHIKSFDGLPTKDKLKMLSSVYNLSEKLHPFINKMKQIYTTELIHTRLKPNFTHEFALSRLKNEGYKLALCSNSISKTISLMMQKASLDKYLDFFLSNEDVKNAKPDPEIYNKAIKRLNLSPKEVLILEDNINGIKSARASGAFVMEVLEVNEVNYKNIKKEILKCESLMKKA